MSKRTQPLKITQPLRAVLHYLAVVRGRASTRQVTEEYLAQAIEDHPVGSDMLALVNRNRARERREKKEKNDG
jgi:hypothetical protein